MLKILERSANRLALKKNHQIGLLTILSGVISGLLLVFGAVVGFGYLLLFLIGIFALICGCSVLYPGFTTYIFDKRSGQFIVTTHYFFFQHTQHLRLQDIVSVNLGLLVEEHQAALAQQYKSFRDQQFLYIKLASGKLLLLTTVDPTTPDELRHCNQVVEQIQAFLNIA